MTQFLPPNLLALFEPRDPIPYMPPHDKLPHEKKQTHNYQAGGIFCRKFGRKLGVLSKKSENLSI